MHKLNNLRVCSVLNDQKRWALCAVTHAQQERDGGGEGGHWRVTTTVKEPVSQRRNSAATVT